MAMLSVASWWVVQPLPDLGNGTRATLESEDICAPPMTLGTLLNLVAPTFRFRRSRGTCRPPYESVLTSR